MKTFKKYLDEALVIVGKKAYPKFGNVVILAGGAGSGKGFVTSNLIAIDAHVFNVDDVKQLILKVPKLRQSLKDVFIKQKESGKLDVIPDIDNKKVRDNLLRDPKMTSALHLAAKNINLPKRIEDRFFVGMMDKDSSRRPNIIYDVTMKDITKLHNISTKLTTHGYDKKNIHIIWVVNEVKVAMEQNRKRPRIVPEDILIDTHEGASRTMAELIKMGNGVRQYIDGDMIIVPSKRNVDSKYIPSKRGKGGYFIFADHYRIKKTGKAVDIKKMTTALEKEIVKFVPKGTFKI